MDLITILFWLAVVTVAWLGLRNLITVFIGSSRTGPLKPGQRLCHATALILYWGACIIAIYAHSWLPLIIGVVIAFVFRQSVIRSGEQV